MILIVTPPQPRQATVPERHSAGWAQRDLCGILLVLSCLRRPLEATDGLSRCSCAAHRPPQSLAPTRNRHHLGSTPTYLRAATSRERRDPTLKTARRFALSAGSRCIAKKCAAEICPSCGVMRHRTPTTHDQQFSTNRKFFVARFLADPPSGLRQTRRPDRPVGGPSELVVEASATSFETYLNSATLDKFHPCVARHHCLLASRDATPRCLLPLCVALRLCSLATCRAPATPGGHPALT